MLKPLHIFGLTGGVDTYQCKHAKEWPPVVLKLGDPEELRAMGRITQNRYERWKTWVRVCGLLEMVESKCPTCPYAEKVKPPKPPAPPGRIIKRRDGR